MRSWLHRSIDIALALACVLLLVRLVLPWQDQPLPTAPAEGASGAAPVSGVVAPRAAVVEPDAILPLLVGRPAVRQSAGPAAPVQPAPSPAAVDAPWLSYLGRSISPDGKTYLFVKDTRSGKVIRAAQGEIINGWTVIDEQKDRLILKNNDTLYSVIKR